MAIKRWHPYLLGLKFVIKTDQQSLKFLLEQKVGTPQQKWFSKLLCYHFQIEYKQGQENKVVGALSRRCQVQQEDRVCMIISAPNLDWIESLKASYAHDSFIQSIISQLQINATFITDFKMLNGLFLKKGRIVVGSEESLKGQILVHVHSSPLGGHTGYEKTLHRARADLFGKGVRKEIRVYVCECDICQRAMIDTHKPYELL